MPYADVATIKPLLCGNESNLGVTTEEFDTQINTLIKWSTAEINAYLGQSFSDVDLAADPDLAAALENVTFQAVDNYLLAVIQRKQSPIVTVGDFTVRNPPRVVLTDNMKKTLDGILNRYKQYPGVAFTAGTERLTSSQTGLIQGNDEEVV